MNQINEKHLRFDAKKIKNYLSYFRISQLEDASKINISFIRQYKVISFENEIGALFKSIETLEKNLERKRDVKEDIQELQQLPDIKMHEDLKTNRRRVTLYAAISQKEHVLKQKLSMMKLMLSVIHSSVQNI